MLEMGPVSVLELISPVITKNRPKLHNKDRKVSIFIQLNKYNSRMLEGGIKA